MTGHESFQAKRIEYFKAMIWQRAGVPETARRPVSQEEGDGVVRFGWSVVLGFKICRALKTWPARRMMHSKCNWKLLEGCQRRS